MKAKTKIWLWLLLFGIMTVLFLGGGDSLDRATPRMFYVLLTVGSFVFLMMDINEQ
jgi:L-asparagine transporter-like permease